MQRKEAWIKFPRISMEMLQFSIASLLMEDRGGWLGFINTRLST